MCAHHTHVHTRISLKGDPVPRDTPLWRDEQLHLLTGSTHHHSIGEYTSHPAAHGEGREGKVERGGGVGEGGKGRGGGRERGKRGRREEGGWVT